MVSTICLTDTGGPEVLRLATTERRAADYGQAWVEHEAIGVNYLDVMQRQGVAPLSLPSGLGLEAAGRVVEVGAGVTDIAVGDRVAYILGPVGSYASGRLYPANRLVRLPDALDFGDAAAILFKGITAQYLITSTFPVGVGTTILLYGASGGLGQVLAPWAKHLGASVIGVVSTESSIPRARAAGCDDVIVWGTCNLPAEIDRLTDGRKVDVVYDGIGKDTFEASIASLRPRGTMVSIGASSGLPDPVPISTLNKDSLFLTRPSLAAHASHVEEYHTRARAVFDALAAGIIKPTISREFTLADAAEAHRALEQGGVNGAVILKP
jgi:NADPH2:quinone reductase